MKAQKCVIGVLLALWISNAGLRASQEAEPRPPNIVFILADDLGFNQIAGIIGEIFQAARRGKWKAVRYGIEAPVTLYDLEADPGETTDLSASEPEIHREFVELLDEYKG